MKKVKIGVGFGLWRLGMPSAETIAHVAERAEHWGVDSFWLSDHLLGPSAELDVIATLAMLASRTSRMKLGPSVFLLNLRHPLLAARAFATLDYLSGGRIVMAVGTGANLDDYAACGVPTEDRDRRLDEGIEVLRAVWREKSASFHGKYFNFDDMTVEPRPAKRTNNDFGTIDIWVGGRSDTVLRRAARLADGYFGSIQTPQEFATRVSTIRKYAAEYGRGNGHIESGLILLCRIGSSRERALEEMKPTLKSLGPRAEQFERSLYGSAEDILERIDEYVACGLDKFVLWPVARPDEWAGQVELLGREIATPLLRARAA